MICMLANVVRWSLNDGDGTASLYDSHRSDLAALLRIYNAHPKWMRVLEKVTQTLTVSPLPGDLQQPPGYPTRGRKKCKVSSSVKHRPIVVTS